MGKKLRAEEAVQIADELEAGDYEVIGVTRRGRPSLASGRTPSLTIRVPQNVRDLAEERAKREGKTLSEVARDALEAYVKQPSRRAGPADQGGIAAAKRK